MHILSLIVWICIYNKGGFWDGSPAFQKAEVFHQKWKLAESMIEHDKMLEMNFGRKPLNYTYAECRWGNVITVNYYSLTSQGMGGIWPKTQSLRGKKHGNFTNFVILALNHSKFFNPWFCFQLYKKHFQLKF